MNKIFYLPIVALSALSFQQQAFALDAAGLADAPSGVSQLAGARQDSIKQAMDFIQAMAQDGIDFLGDETLTTEQRKEEFRRLLRSSYDMQTIGRFALGSYWKSLSASQRAEYQKLFENMIVEIYSRRFGQYKGQQLQVRDARGENDTDITVRSVIIPSGAGEEVQVDWRVRSNNGHYKVIDVIVAGVSMALTQRSDFSSVIQRGGGDVGVLLEHLRKAEAPAQAKTQ